MKIAIGISGASGSVYAKRLIEVLSSNHELFVVYSDVARQIFLEENATDIDEFLKSKKNIKVFDNSNLAAPVSSGSFIIDACIVIPCSMKTLSSIANGFCDTLIVRCADVTLKEHRKLIVAPRETPLSSIQIENMLKIANSGGVILPLMPAFYHKPKTIDDLVDFLVGKIIDQLKIDHNLFKRWE